MTLLFRAILALVFVGLGTGVARTQETEVMVVLDVSGSMWGQIDGVSKIEIARDVFGDLSEQWRLQNINAGLIAYGHRRKGDCADIELLSRPSAEATSQLGEIVSRLLPKGKTPLSNAVRLAAEEMKFTENAATVILLSDGIETCKSDPCALGAELEELGIDFTVHVIGFNIAAEQDKRQLQCLAGQTGGRYFDTVDADGLASALRDAAISDEKEIRTQMRNVRFLIDEQEGTTRPQAVELALRAPETGELTPLGRLDGTVEVIEGRGFDVPIGTWIASASGPEGNGEIRVQIDEDTQEVSIPFAAPKPVFSYRDFGPYQARTQHRIFIEVGGSIQPGAEYTLAFMHNGERVDWKSIFGSDGVGLRSFDFTPPEPGDYEILVYKNMDDPLAQFELQALDDAQPQWTGSRSGVAGGTIGVGITANTYYYNQLKLLYADGNEISRISVDALGKNGLQLPLPKEPGQYRLEYSYKTPSGDSATADLGMIDVSSAANGEALPDDPDTVAPPDEMHDAALHSQGLGADEHGWEPASEPSTADPAILRKKDISELVFVCRQAQCLYDDPHTGLTGIPLIGDYGILEPIVHPDGSPFLEIINEWNGEWLALNPMRQTNMTTSCVEFYDQGWHVELAPGADKDIACVMNGAGGRTHTQMELIADWQARRNRASSDRGMAEETDAMGGEEQPVTPAGEMQGNWLLRDDQTGAELMRVQILHDEGSDSLDTDLAGLNEGAFKGIQKGFDGEADMTLTRQDDGSIAGIQINVITAGGPLQGILLRPPEWDGHTDIWHGMLTLIVDATKPRVARVKMVPAGDR